VHPQGENSIFCINEFSLACSVPCTTFATSRILNK
jgi:hypothetical protein